MSHLRLHLYRPAMFCVLIALFLRIFCSVQVKSETASLYSLKCSFCEAYSHLLLHEMAFFMWLRDDTITTVRGVIDYSPVAWSETC